MKTIAFSIVIIASFTHFALGHGSSEKPKPGDPREISFPDTANYLTLVLDPHTHSVFSDGHVWPRIRVGEALRDGLDAYAVTEHLEYQPHLADIPHPDRNQSFREATAAAKGSDLIVIPGAEITRDFPAGHMNAIFISDANKLLKIPAGVTDVNEFRNKAKEWPSQKAVEAANDQGAFVFWNHAYWTRDFPTGIPEMPDFHLNNIKAGLLHGIEVANGDNYSENTFQMALDHNLTLIGVSDVHQLIDWDYEPYKGGHRPVTLVFAKERTAESMKEALFDRRTVVWFKNILIGRAPQLNPLLSACLSLEDVTYGNGEILNVTVRNNSDADFQLRNRSPYGFFSNADLVTVPQHGSLDLMVKTGKKVSSIELEFEVLNALTSPKQTASVTLTAKVR